MSADESNKWMTTFADLLSLLLTFFILLFAMSEVKRQDWQELTSSLQGRLNPSFESEKIVQNERPPAQRVRVNNGLHLPYLQNLLQQKLATELGANAVQLTLESDRLIVTMSSDTLFRASSAGFSSNGVPAVRTVANAIANIPNKIVVIGHTDPRPISTAEYPSNWELSLARGYAVANLIRGAGYSHVIEVFGMASGKYKDIDKTKHPSEKTRFRLARRVDIAIMKTKNW